LVFDLGPPVY